MGVIHNIKDRADGDGFKIRPRPRRFKTIVQALLNSFVAFVSFVFRILLSV